MNGIANPLPGAVSVGNQAASVSIMTALAGIFLYAAFAFQFLGSPEYPHFGTAIYDRYYLALLDGRLELPASIVRFEGHYAPDGTAYLYHGMAPLLTRFALGWIVPLESVSLAPFSILLWTVVGTALLHLLLFRLTLQNAPFASRSAAWAFWLAVLVWLGTPGILMAANTAFYHETSVVAFAASLGLIYAFTSFRFFGMPLSRALILMAVCAAISLHARPNVAVGLYIVSVAACGLGLWRARKSALMPVLAAILILAVSGIGYLALNKLKFGDATVTHGSFSQSARQYGPVFWKVETAESKQIKEAFVEHGRFNIKRILPNLGFYALDPPEYLSPELSEKALALYRQMTENALGLVRVEGPRTGIVFLWLPWLVLIVLTVAKSRVGDQFLINMPLVLGTAVTTALTLSYGTITLRYRFDMWPLVAAMAVMVWPLVAQRFVEVWHSSRRVLAGVLILIGVQATVLNAFQYVQFFPENPDSFFRPWTPEFCKALVEHKGLPDDSVSEICVH